MQGNLPLLLPLLHTLVEERVGVRRFPILEKDRESFFARNLGRSSARSAAALPSLSLR
jgi:hypothetical protein